MYGMSGVARGAGMTSFVDFEIAVGPLLTIVRNQIGVVFMNVLS